jgi:hypothetical protein
MIIHQNSINMSGEEIKGSKFTKGDEVVVKKKGVGYQHFHNINDKGVVVGVYKIEGEVVIDVLVGDLVQGMLSTDLELFKTKEN